jgi:hypothetical protein
MVERVTEVQRLSFPRAGQLGKGAQAVKIQGRVQLSV